MKWTFVTVQHHLPSRSRCCAFCMLRLLSPRLDMIVSAHVKGAHNKPLEHESVNRLTRRNGPGHLSSRFLLTRRGRGSPSDPLFVVFFYITSTRRPFAFTHRLYKRYKVLRQPSWHGGLWQRVGEGATEPGRRDKSLHEVQVLTELPPVWVRGQHLWNRLVKLGSLH